MKRSQQFMSLSDCTYAGAAAREKLCPALRPALLNIIKGDSDNDGRNTADLDPSESIYSVCSTRITRSRSIESSMSKSDVSSCSYPAKTDDEAYFFWDEGNDESGVLSVAEHDRGSHKKQYVSPDIFRKAAHSQQPSASKSPQPECWVPGVRTSARTASPLSTKRLIKIVQFANENGLASCLERLLRLSDPPRIALKSTVPVVIERGS